MLAEIQASRAELAKQGGVRSWWGTTKGELFLLSPKLQLSAVDFQLWDQQKEGLPLMPDSFVDILYIGRVMPKHAAIMAKKSLRWIPGLGWFSATMF